MPHMNKHLKIVYLHTFVVSRAFMAGAASLAGDADSSRAPGITSYIVSVHIQCQASIYTLSLCRGHSWRVRLA